MKKDIDAMSPRGLVAVEWARKGLQTWIKSNPQYCYMETKQDRYADLDAIIGKPDGSWADKHIGDKVDARCLWIGSEVEEVMEIKSRFDVTEEKFFNDWAGKWLVTYDKLKRCYDTAYSLRANLTGLLVLVDSKICYHKLLAEYNKDTGGLEWRIKFEVMTTETQKTINGGTALRENAYIDMNGVEGLRI
tara:strand:+ start:6184 stop:6753 length:570 start_codon:yes stop_codon:yes gene_type:complete